jgi:hypothetical protein
MPIGISVASELAGTGRVEPGWLEAAETEEMLVSEQ